MITFSDFVKKNKIINKIHYEEALHTKETLFQQPDSRRLKKDTITNNSMILGNRRLHTWIKTAVLLREHTVPQLVAFVTIKIILQRMILLKVK